MRGQRCRELQSARCSRQGRANLLCKTASEKSKLFCILKFCPDFGD